MIDRLLRAGSRIVIATVLLTGAMPASAARWEIMGAAPEIALDTSTVGPSLRFPGATGIWLTYAPSMSVDCSPPRGCYAKTQRTYYLFNCAPRWAVPMERLSADLNGSVIKHELREEGEPYSANADVAAFVILETFCPLHGWRDRR